MTSTVKKILLATRPLCTPWDEASKNFAYFLAKSIHDEHLRLTVLTTPEQLEGLAPNVQSLPIFPLYDTRRAGHSFSQKAILSKYLFLNSFRYDIVHYLFTPTTLNASLITHLTFRRPKSIQTIATLREDIYGPEQWKKMFFADKLVVYSEYSRMKLLEAGFTNVHRIYPGTDLTLYSPQAKDANTMQHFNVSADDFVLGYFGEYARLGATDMLVEMLTKHLANAKEQFHRNLVFIFACRVKNDADQHKKDEVIQKLTETGIIDSVRFSDTWKDMPKLYNLVDIVLFPVENMRGKFDIPLVIIEGYACAKPVIVSDLPIFGEFAGASYAEVVPRNNATALWNTIANLLHNEAKRKSLGTNARLFVEQHFDLQNTARAYERLYSQV